MSTSSYPKVFTQTHHKDPKALDGVGGGGVRGFNAHNKDLGKLSSGSIGPYPPPPYPHKGPYDYNQRISWSCRTFCQGTCNSGLACGFQAVLGTVGFPYNPDPILGEIGKE